MQSVALTITCSFQLGAQEVELLVLHADPAWRWEIRCADGKTLEAGEATTRLAAQLEAEHSFESRMKRAGLFPLHFGGFRWQLKS